MMGNVLRFFPKNSLVFLTSLSELGAIPKSDRGWLPFKYYYYDSFLSKVDRKKNQKNIRGKNLFSLPVDRLKNEASFLLDLYLLIRSGLKVIKEERPDLLVGTSGSTHIISVYLLHKITGIPYFIWLQDLYHATLNSSISNIFTNHFEMSVFKEARKVIVTNEGTVDYYKKRHGIETVLIYNSLIPTIKPSLTKKKNKKQSNIVYAGDIYWAQRDSITNIIKAVNSLRKINIKFYILCQRSKNYLANLGICEGNRIIIRSIKPENVQQLLVKMDIGVVPLSFHTQNQDIILTATPGKYWEYLLAEIPVLVHAPRDSFLVKYASNHKAALIVSDENIANLRQAIVELLYNTALREKLINNGKELFYKNHDARKNSQKFLSLFRQV